MVRCFEPGIGERLTDEDEIKANQKWVEQERQRRKKTTGIEK